MVEDPPRVIRASPSAANETPRSTLFCSFWRSSHHPSRGTKITAMPVRKPE